MQVLQTLPACDPEDDFTESVGKVAGFSLHAGVAARADEREKLERLSLTSGGNVRYQLKTPYRDGTTHVIFEPLDFIARLAALVPKARAALAGQALAAIEDPAVIEKILTHLQEKVTSGASGRLPPAGLFG